MKKGYSRRIIMSVIRYGVGMILLSASEARVAEASQPSALDFLIQNVCLDRFGKILANQNPTSCTTSRDLALGEPTPYHKHDWPTETDRAQHPDGYQRSDSFPFKINGSNVVLQTFDFGGGNRSFDTFDEGDGGQIAALSKWGAYLAATEDASGFQLFTGKNCLSSAGIKSLEDSWILFPNNLDDGQRVTLMRISRDLTCPINFARKLTVWRRKNISYRINLEGTLSSPLVSIITDQFVGQDVESSAAMERHYHTRELGLTRWEAWRNLSITESKGEFERRATRVNSGGRCGERMAGPRPGWVMVDCREWTNIIPVTSGSKTMDVFWESRFSRSTKILNFFRP